MCLHILRLFTVLIKFIIHNDDSLRFLPSSFAIPSSRLESVVNAVEHSAKNLNFIKYRMSHQLLLVKNHGR